jgi:PKHD-type hydroxylase
MLVAIPEVLNLEEIVNCRKILSEADWVDGRITAGYQSALVKNNSQLPEDHPAARILQDVVLDALERNALFISAALPLKIFPPLFNSYSIGQSFGAHIDNSIRQIKGTPHRVRTDLSATLFLSEPEEYEGGELVIEDNFGVQKIKLPAGHMILYPASSVHHVTPITSGKRVASFFWIQSMVRGDEERRILFDLDVAIQNILNQIGNDNSAVQLTGVYHNLLRRFGDV